MKLQKQLNKSERKLIVQAQNLIDGAASKGTIAKMAAQKGAETLKKTADKKADQLIQEADIQANKLVEEAKAKRVMN